MQTLVDISIIICFGMIIYISITDNSAMVFKKYDLYKNHLDSFLFFFIPLRALKKERKNQTNPAIIEEINNCIKKRKLFYLYLFGFVILFFIGALLNR
jgi:hypothetical protein